MDVLTLLALAKANKGGGTPSYEETVLYEGSITLSASPQTITFVDGADLSHPEQWIVTVGENTAYYSNGVFSYFKSPSDLFTVTYDNPDWTIVGKPATTVDVKIVSVPTLTVAKNGAVDVVDYRLAYVNVLPDICEVSFTNNTTGYIKYGYTVVTGTTLSVESGTSLTSPSIAPSSSFNRKMVRGSLLMVRHDTIALEIVGASNVIYSSDYHIALVQVPYSTSATITVGER